MSLQMSMGTLYNRPIGIMIIGTINEQAVIEAFDKRHGGGD
jgi:hypothetical protein